jgi:hypothetical protein
MIQREENIELNRIRDLEDKLRRARQSKIKMEERRVSKIEISGKS